MRLLIALPLAALLLAGCNRSQGDHASTPAAAAPASAHDTAATAPAVTMPAVTMRYACDGNTSVEVMGAGKARATLPDSRVIELTRVADSAPPVFAGGSLYFAIGSTDAHLSQEDGTNELTCGPQ